MDGDAMLARRVRESLMPDHGLRRIGSPDMIMFGGGLPDPTTFPSKDIGRILSRILSGTDRRLLGYGYERGDSSLREIIAARARQQGSAVGAEEVVLTNGSSGGIGLVAAALIDPGDVVIAEAATYPGALKAFRQMGAHIQPAPMDEEGLDPDGLAGLLEQLTREGRRIKFIYTIATCQNPTATIMRLERRREILRLAERHGAIVVHDNTYGDILFAANPASFIALDQVRALHLGSFSKTIAPGIRVGWVGAPRRIAEALVQVRTDLGTSPILQRAVASYIEDGKFDAHLAEVTAHYQRKRDVMLLGLERYCRDVASWGVPEGGFFVWLRLKSGDVRAALDAAEEEKVSFIPGAYFAVSPASFPRHLRLSYGEIPEDQIDEGLRRLGRALARVAP